MNIFSWFKRKNPNSLIQIDYGKLSDRVLKDIESNFRFEPRGFNLSDADRAFLGVDIKVTEITAYYCTPETSLWEKDRRCYYLFVVDKSRFTETVGGPIYYISPYYTSLSNYQFSQLRFRDAKQLADFTAAITRLQFRLSTNTTNAHAKRILSCFPGVDYKL
jgi:hypothetical protein